MEHFYRRWGLRDGIGDAVKRQINNLGRSAEARSVNRLANHVLKDLQTQSLTTEEGQRHLAELVADRILEAFEPDCEDVSQLTFHKHLSKFCYSLFQYEKLFELPSALFNADNQTGGWFSTCSVTKSELWNIEDQLKRTSKILDEFDEAMGTLALMTYHLVTPLVEACPSLLEEGSAASSGIGAASADDTRSENSNADTRGIAFTAPLSSLINEPATLVDLYLQLPFASEFETHSTTTNMQVRLMYNLNIASGGVPGEEKTNPAKPRMPERYGAFSSIDELSDAYLAGTPLPLLLNYSVPMSVPAETRFAHHMIVAGSGHGKTQTLQHLLLNDLRQVSEGGASIVVLDSQGDLINNIAGLEMFAPGNPLADRLIVIDPTDVEYPVSLNLFDVNMDRINEYSQLDRERMVNGILELYDFVLGSLLAAEMTQKQSVIFRYITRLLLHIPNATIHTLRELLEDGGSAKYQQYIHTLEGSARAFFETEFDSREFSQTKRQVVRRLWGILENQTFERMFSHPRNKLDLYSEMNAGKVILINTAKDLLKENGTEIFGRFFIAMIAQAAQERATIAKDKRMSTYVYIDEAHDYFDQNIAIILSQARKYKVGMILAHQYLGQLDNKLQEAVFANTAIKMAGGVSAKDARTLANEMRTTPDFIEQQQELSFAAFIKGTTKQATSLSVKYGQMEKLSRMSADNRKVQRQVMRERYAQHYSEAGHPSTDQVTDDPADLNSADDGDSQLGRGFDLDNLPESKPAEWK